MPDPFDSPEGQTRAKSRVFRQVVTMEVLWTVEPGEPVFRDWEAVVRDAIMAAEPSAGWPGTGTITDMEELTSDA